MTHDRTYLLKASGKMLQMKGVKPNSEDDNQKDQVVSSKAYKMLVKEALRVKSSMYDFYLSIVEKRKDYMSCNSPAISMLESDRVEFEKTATSILKLMSDNIKTLKTRVLRETMRDSEKEHLTYVCTMMESYCKSIRTLFTDLKNVRAKYLKLKPANSRLGGLVNAVRDISDSPGFPETKIRKRRIARIEENVAAVKNEIPPTAHLIKDYNEPEETERRRDFEPPELSQKDRAQLTIENDSLFEKFNHMNRDVENLEDQIFAIQNLQYTLNEKINTQSQIIDTVDEQAMHTNMAIEAGNDWIRKTLANSAGRRIFMLFSLIVITFALLFVDWYNP